MIPSQLHRDSLPVDVPTVGFDICVVNFNTKVLTLACLDYLKQSVPAYGCTTWVVDNGSTDGSIEALRARPDITLLCRSPDAPEEGHTAHANAIDLVFHASDKNIWS